MFEDGYVFLDCRDLLVQWQFNMQMVFWNNHYWTFFIGYLLPGFTGKGLFLVADSGYWGSQLTGVAAVGTFTIVASAAVLIVKKGLSALKFLDLKKLKALISENMALKFILTLKKVSSY
jgi:hypothetical protein